MTHLSLGRRRLCQLEVIVLWQRQRSFDVALVSVRRANGMVLIRFGEGRPDP